MFNVWLSARYLVLVYRKNRLLFSVILIMPVFMVSEYVCCLFGFHVCLTEEESITILCGSHHASL